MKAYGVPRYFSELYGIYECHSVGAKTRYNGRYTKNGKDMRSNQKTQSKRGSRRLWKKKARRQQKKEIQHQIELWELRQ